MSGNEYIQQYKKINQLLGGYNIHPILYGSVGASIYLGEFKKFNDLDLLIENQWVKAKWEKFKSIMAGEGFVVVDEKEHEFENEHGVRLAFAAHSILTRDKIVDPATGVVIVSASGVEVRTLTPQGFLKAYEFSVDDGYRTEQRGKKDSEAIKLLKSYIENLEK